MLYEDLYRENHEKIFLLEAIRPRALIYWYEASSSRLLPSLFKLYPWSQKWPRPGGHMFYTGLYREQHEKIYLSETTRPRVLIFSM